MSAFFVEKITIDRSVRYMMADKGLDPKSQEFMTEASKLGSELWAMNAEALRQRYRLDGSAELLGYEETAEDYVYVQGEEFCPSTCHTAARCLRYQCSEGDIGEGNEKFDPLYKALSDRIELLEKFASLRSISGAWR